MKVLLFTHEQDIDGIGNIIIAKQAFTHLDYITCKTFEVNQKIQETIDNKSIYNYDYIFVTDICIKEPLLSFINNDNTLKNKLLIFDHHKSEIEEGNNQYPFVNIIVENEKGKTCGTSLFYDYLVKNNLLSPTKSLDELVELTRQHDTWEWKEKFGGNENARNLYILFEKLGIEKYINTITKIIETKEHIELDTTEQNLINEFKKELNSALDKMIANMLVHTMTIDGTTYKIGFTKSLYKYRNELSEFILSTGNKQDLDMVGIIMEDTSTVSYRKVKNVDVSKVAVYYGGKGHKGAASNSQENPKFQEILKLFKQTY